MRPISFNAAFINGYFDIAFRDGAVLVQLPPPLDVVVVSQALNIKAANTVVAREKTFDIHKTSLFTESQPILSVKMAYIVNRFCKVEPLKRIL